MKKLISIMLFVLMLVSLYPGAGIAEEPKLSVITTIFPPYDFVRTIVGDAVELAMLLPPGSESHSFEPTPRDIIAIQNCDVFIYTGGQGDIWIERILASMDTSNMTLLPMLEMVDAVEEVIVEGMEDDHEHGHEGDHGYDEEEEFDPSKVYDRPLTDWEGSWKSLAPYLEDGSLDEYVQMQADEREVSFEERMENRKQSWRTDEFDYFMIEGDTVTIDTGDAAYSGDYSYEGFAILESDSGATVWYQYALAGDAEGMPKFIIFSDHGYGVAPEEDHHDEDEHDEGDEDDHRHGHDHGDELAHTHFRYGDESLEALVNTEGWNPYFVGAEGTIEQIMETLVGHGHGSQGHDHDDESKLDEHVWTSPENAKRIVLQIADVLASLDPSRADLFAQNTAAYVLELDALDQAFQEVVDTAARKTIVFGDRFPFRYLADAYGLTYFAAFPGCATETEASAATIKFLIDKVKEEGIPVVFTIELSNGRIADAIAESTGAKKLDMHSTHNVTKTDFEKGVSYMELMWQNVEKLKEALN